MTDHEITALFLQRSENAIRESQVKYGCGLTRKVEKSRKSRKSPNKALKWLEIGFL